MLNNKLYEDKAKELTKRYLKNNPDLKFIPIFGEDEEGRPTVIFQIIKVNMEVK